MPPFVLALLGALVPSLAWLAFFYTRDRHDPEPKGLILRLFLLGAFGVSLVAGLVNTVLLLGLAGGDLTTATAAALFGTFAVGIAPVTEETLKYLGTSLGARRSRAFDEPVDGIIYGVTVGLGFAAAESVDYLTQAIEGVGPLGTPIGFCTAGVDCLVQTAFLRGMGSAVLHAAASGIAGYGLTRRVLDGRPRRTAVGWVLVAMLCHALWNATGFLSLALPVVILVTLMGRSMRRSPFAPPRW